MSGTDLYPSNGASSYTEGHRGTLKSTLNLKTLDVVAGAQGWEVKLKMLGPTDVEARTPES